MTPSTIRGLLDARPFRPFKLLLPDSRHIPVTQPDRVMLSPNGGSAIVYQDDDDFSIVKVTRCHGIEMIGDAAPCPPTPPWMTNGTNPSPAKPTREPPMSTPELVDRIVRKLPTDMQRQLLTYATYLAMLAERMEWQQLSLEIMAREWGEDEPEYSLADVKPMPTP